jgi:hypothetical protein
VLVLVLVPLLVLVLVPVPVLMLVPVPVPVLVLVPLQAEVTLPPLLPLLLHKAKVNLHAKVLTTSPL